MKIWPGFVALIESLQHTADKEKVNSAPVTAHDESPWAWLFIANSVAMVRMDNIAIDLLVGQLSGPQSTEELFASHSLHCMTFNVEGIAA